MILKDRDLYINMQGDDVRRLQTGLKKLGFNIPEEEFRKKFFGPGTSKAVIDFEERNGIQGTGIVNGAIIKLITDQLKEKQTQQRQQLKKRQQPEPQSQQAEPFIVRGQIRKADGSLLVGAIVRAFDKDLRSEEILGEQTLTDKDGLYEIKYYPQQFARAEKESADLIVRVFNQEGLPLTASSIIFNAQQSETVDLMIGGGRYRGQSEYDQLITELTPLLQGLGPADLTEDEKNQDISFLSGETGKDPQLITLIVLANRMSQKTNLPPEVFYAFFRERLPTNLSALLSQQPNTQRRALESAINKNIISEMMRTKIDNILRRLRELIIDYAFEQPVQNGKTSLSTLLGTVVQSIEKQKKFLTLYVRHQGTIEDFWKGLHQDPEFQNDIEQIQFTLQAGALTWNHLPLVRELQSMRQDGKVKSVIQLAKLDINDWVELINKKSGKEIVGFPSDIPGKDQSEKINNYANIIVNIMEDSFPTAIIASHIEKDDHLESKHDLTTFFTKNEEFDLNTTYIPSYFKQNQHLLEGIADKEGLKVRLQNLQRVFKLTPHYSEISTLLSDGLTSGYSISMMGQKVFLNKYGQKFGDNTRAQSIYENALQTSSTAMHILVSLDPMSNRINLPVLYSESVPKAGGPVEPPPTPPPLTPELTNPSVSDLKALFGSFDLCECEHCRSVLSPAAYLVDVLHFLSYRPSKIGSKNVKDILFARRPDIGEIELTCENTNTPIPYVDLVNEVLENAIFPMIFGIDVKFQTDLDSKVISQDLIEEFRYYDFNLSSSATISVQNKGYQWLIRDIGSRYVAIKDDTQIKISYFPQTSWSAEELSANPEHVNIGAINTLEHVVYPWQFPFNFWNEEVTIYLNHLGLNRSELMKIFQKVTDPKTPTYNAIAIAYLGLTKKERHIITGIAPEKPWEFWGYSKELDVDKWSDKLSDVNTFLEKSALAYEDLIGLIETKFIDPDSAIRIKSNDPADPLTCDIEKLVITHQVQKIDPDGKVSFVEEVGFPDGMLDRIHKFKRLQQKLKWTTIDLDKAITALNPPELNDDFLVQLSHIKKICTDFSISVASVLAWYSHIDTTKYVDSKNSEIDSLYDELFQNPSIIRLASDDEDLFKLNKARTELEVVEKVTADGDRIRFFDNKDVKYDKMIWATLVGALGVSDSDLSLLISSTTKAVVTKDKKLNLENLSRLYRAVSFAKALQLSIQDLLDLQAITGINPFVKIVDAKPVINTKNTLNFIEATKKISSSGFTISELNYLLRHNSSEVSGLGPKEEDVAFTLQDIRSGLHKIHDETIVMPDPTGDLTRKKLASLKWDNALIEEIISALNGTAEYSTPLAVLPSDTVFSDMIKDKVSYDGKNLRFIGPMTLDEKKSMSSATLSDIDPHSEYQLAVDRLFEQPRIFVSKKMRAYELPTFHASLEHLPSSVVFPTDLKDKIYYDIATKKEELHFVGAMTGSEKEELLSLSDDVPYQSAINELFDAPDTFVPEPNNRFLTDSDLSELFDSSAPPATIVEKRFKIVMTKLLTYLRNSLSERLVKQKLGEALKLEIKTVDQLLTKLVYVPNYPTLKSMSAFLAPEFSESNQNILMTSMAFADQFSIFTLLYKIAMIISKFNITSKQLTWLSDYYSPPSRWLDINSLPLQELNYSLDDLKKSSELFNGWEKLYDLFQLIDRLPNVLEILSQMFDSADNSEAILAPMDHDSEEYKKKKAELEQDLLNRLSEKTKWNLPDLQILVGKEGLDYNYPDDFKDYVVLNRLRICFNMMKRLGMSAADSISISNPFDDPTVENAIRIKSGLKSNYEQVQWLAIIKPLHDVLREKERSMLVSYLVSNSGDIGKKNWKDSNDLYQYFLIDVEMSACQMTSRIKQANSSCQLFVQRCLMNLESNDVTANTELDNEWLNWKWMKNYRVWEANRKVFLYPENWIEPELRDDKSPFFEELENELLQKEITKDTAETAFLHYLEKLDVVARLEICGMYHQVDTDVDILHVIGRTQGTPHQYYYRQRIDYQRLGQHARWTAWEKMDLDLSDVDHLIPVIWNRRLYLFWPIFKVKPDDEPGITDPDTKGGPPSKHLEIHLAWSQYWEKKWQAKKVSEEFAPYPANESDSKLNESDSELKLFLKRFHFKVISNTSNLIIAAFLDDDETGTASHECASFFVNVCDGRVQAIALGKDVTDTWGITESISPIGTHQENMGISSDSGTYELHLQVFNRKILEVEKIKDTQAARKDVPTLNSIKSPFSLLVPHQEREFTSDEPFFFQDAYRTFFILPKTVMLPTSTWHELDKVPLEIIDEVPSAYYYSSDTKPLLPITDHLNFEPVSPVVTLPVSDGPANVLSDVPHINSESSEALIAGMTESMDLVVTSKSKKKYLFQTYYHPYVCNFIKELNMQGIDGFMQRKIQQESLDYFEKEYNPTDVVEMHYYPIDDVDFEYGGAYSLYNWELFFHAPLLIAYMLSKNQHFEDAQKWLHYIFNPTDTSAYDVPRRYWQMRKFFDTTTAEYQRQKIQNLLNLLASGTHDYELEAQVKEWRDNPFKPHVIARLRTTAYQLNVTMKYLDNLIAWGDQLFRQDTIESINEAAQLYILAAEILGKRPLNIPPRASPQAQTYNTLEPRFKTDLSDFSNPLVSIEEILTPCRPDSVITSEIRPTILPLMLFFCLPQNDYLIKYWDTVADRLFKIRHCMNIEGIVRQLPLFEPPIDPSLLVRAAAAGIDISSALNDMDAALPNYRFRIMMQKAVDLCTEVKALGSAMLLALEKRDSEYLALLRSGHEIGLLNKIRDIKQQQIDEASITLDSLMKSKDLVTIRRDYYTNIENMNQSEKLGIELAAGAMISQAIAVVLDVIAAATHLAPQLTVGVSGSMGSPVATASVGGQSAADSTEAFATALHGISSVLNMGSSMAATVGGYQRRSDDWDLQKRLANKELEQVDRQIAAANIRLAIANNDLNNHDLQIENAKEMHTQMQDKFTNMELYNWMIGQISGIYFQSYQLAYDMAKRTERTYRFELGLEDSKFIQFGYWDSLKKGLLAGELLYHDLKRMETSYLDQNKREYEITKHISLMAIDPMALIKLKEKGDCFVELPEILFDMDYPGHYMRRVKSVNMTIPCIAGPYTSINCRLTLMKSSFRKSGSSSGPKGEEAGVYSRSKTDDPRFVDNVTMIQSIVTSSGLNDSGMFELNFQDERYLPFEYAGAISTWRIELDRESNHFDFNTISDVILQVRYTARDGGDQLKAAAKKNVLEQIVKSPAVRLFSARHEFPTKWNEFLNPDDNETTQSLELDLTKERFPFEYDEKTLKINKIQIFLKLKNGFTYDSTDSTSKLTISLTPPQMDSSDSGTTVIGTLDVITGSMADLPSCDLPPGGSTFAKGDLSDETKKWVFKIDRDKIPEWLRQKKKDDGTDEFVAIDDVKYYRMNLDAIQDVGILCFYSGNMRK